LPGQGEKILLEVLLSLAWGEPEEALSVAQNAGTPYRQAKVLLETAQALNKAHMEENLKALEKALQFAQRTKNFPLLSEIASAWFCVAPDKGREVLSQVEPREIRIQALRQMARQSVSRQPQEAKRILEQATQEALRVEELGGRIKLLKEIAGDWMSLDPGRAKATFLQVFQIAEKAAISSPSF